MSDSKESDSGVHIVVGICFAIILFVETIVMLIVHKIWTSVFCQKSYDEAHNIFLRLMKVAFFIGIFHFMPVILMLIGTIIAVVLSFVEMLAFMSPNATAGAEDKLFSSEWFDYHWILCFPVDVYAKINEILQNNEALVALSNSVPFIWKFYVDPVFLSYHIVSILCLPLTLKWYLSVSNEINESWCLGERWDH
jgi:hypothetical protein